MPDGIEWFCVRICPLLAVAAPFVVPAGMEVGGGATAHGQRGDDGDKGMFRGTGGREDAAAELRAVDAFVERH